MKYETWARRDVPTLDRGTDGQASPIPQRVGPTPGASSGRASDKPQLSTATGLEGHTPVVTSDNEALAKTTDGEVSRKPMKAFPATSIQAGRIVRSILPPLCISLLFLSSCRPYKPVPLSSSRGRITQVSVINALMIGRYGGVMPIPELLGCGNFGVGTLDQLDGELIVLDGRAYQASGDGGVVEVGSDRSTPFAIVTPFEPDGGFPCPRVGSLSDLDARLNDGLRRQNNFLAIRVDGRFASITLRSVHRQEPPYRPLSEVAKGQSVWTHEEVSGTLVGIHCPAWVGGLNVPGYHWHFLSDDRKVGGHVLDCRVGAGRVRDDVCHDWLIKIDSSAEFNGAKLGEDLSRDLQRVEGSRREGSQDGAPGR